MANQVILGIIDNYNFHQLKKFIYSIKRTSYQGDIVFFVGPKTSKSTIRSLKNMNISLKFFPGLERLPEGNLAEREFKFPAGINYFNYRHYLYLDFFLQSEKSYDWIFLTDIRDVYFQRSPFDEIPLQPGLYCALEGLGRKLADCSYNGKWMEFIYGKEGLSRVGHNTISCAGTTWGTREEIIFYLRAMLKEIERLPDAKTAIDQAIHNYLIYTGALRNLHLIGNNEGIVLTFSHEDNFIVRDDKVFVKEERLVNVLHQFDRVPQLKKLTDKLYLTETFQKYLNHQYHEMMFLGKRIKKKILSKLH